MMDSCGLEVILGDGRPPPVCPHGPMLLFERKFTVVKTGRRFYACSAYRDRKLCPTFYWEDDSQLQKPKTLPKEKTETQQSKYARFKQFKDLPDLERHFCRDCGILFTSASEHQDHDTVCPVVLTDLFSPTRLMAPKTHAKMEAQFFFSNQTTSFLVSALKELKVQRVLCIGTPRLHEQIILSKASISSLLLDIDKRYEQFYPSKLFCQYNVFNHHFFRGEKSKEKYTQFLTLGKSEQQEIKNGTAHPLLVVLDPPFGGLVNVLASTLKKIQDEFHSFNGLLDTVMPFILVFPYFMERRIVEELPETAMLDYKVHYENHQLYRNSNKPGRKYQSPIRLFTNMQPILIKLPSAEGYWACKICQRFSAKENRHCEACGSCTSKDGTTYKHCVLCNRCVKPSRVHCDTCDMCHLPGQHEKGSVQQTGCYICGESGHKRKDCPNIALQRERKLGQKRPHLKGFKMNYVGKNQKGGSPTKIRKVSKTQRGKKVLTKKNKNKVGKRKRKDPRM